MTFLARPAVRWVWLVLVLAVLLAGDAIRFTVGWTVFGILAVIVGIVAALILVADRRTWRLRDLPAPFVAFLALATLSLAWSAYPGATALGLLTTWLIAIAAVAIGLTVPPARLIRALAAVIGGVLALSIVFELVVATIIRRPVLPLFPQPGVDYSQYETIPKMLYWSRNELFEVFDEGRIQGILGNANNLGFLALLGLIVFALAAADELLRRPVAMTGVALSALTIFLTRSATVTVALVAVLAVAAAALAMRRAATPRARTVTWVSLLAIGAAGITAVIVLRETLLGLLGKSSDLTGRLGIWDAVIALAEQRPVVGWGWVSFWMPWAAPFDDLAFRNGVRQLQAHNAWIDLWLQLGLIGVAVFAALVISALVRSWTTAVDRPQHLAGHPEPYRATALLPLLVLAALVVQSIAESRLLVEYGWALLIVMAITTKRGDAPAEAPRP
jgi:exopolysaccharide production protein ExoQ